MDSKKWTKEEMEEKLKMKIHPAMKFRRNLSLAMILTVSVGGSAPRQGVREGGNRLQVASFFSGSVRSGRGP
jgi:hypothetical protein